MAQSIAFGAYTIHIDGSKLTVLDQNGQLVAAADVTADATAKISLPNGQVLDMGQLADALASDHIADFATAAGGSSGAAGGGSGMFFHNAHGQGLGGFDEMQVIKSSPVNPGTTPSFEQPTTFIVQQNAPADTGTTPPPPSDQPSTNHAPSASDSGVTMAEDTPLHGNVTATDPDGDTLSYQLVSGPSHGTLVFHNNGSYTYTPNGDYNGTDSFTYKANDGTADSQPATVNLTVTPVNDAPIATNETVTIQEDTALHGSVTATDVDGDHLTYSLISGPQHGAISFNSDGTYTYTPNADYNGSDSFNFKANDGNVDSQPATVSLTITPVNDAPVATSETLVTKEDTPLHGSVTATDVDGDTLTYSLVNGPQHGTISFNSDGTYTYTPNADYNGGDNFTYKANDGSLSSNTGSVNLTVTAVDDAPVATDEALTTKENTALNSSVIATDVDGDHLTYSLVDGPQHGSVAFNSDGTFTYTPDGNYSGADSFTYKANDGSLDSQAATVNLNVAAASVTPVNEAPVATNETLTTREDTAFHGSVTATDVDGDSLTYSLVNGPQHGTVSFNNDGTFTYTPNADYNGGDSFTFKASDGGLSSNTGTVSLTVNAVNDAPVANGEALTTNEDTVVHGSVTATDVDGDSLTYSLVNGPQHGTVSFNADGTYTYTPNADYNGADSFTYKANDGTVDSQPATVSLTINPANDAPVAGNTAATTAEDTTLHGSVTATDVDGDSLTYSLVNGPQHGTVAFNSDGTYTYTPNADYSGTDTFSYKANDGSLNSNTGTVNLTVTPVNDAPVAGNAVVTTAEDTAVQNHVTATDVDGDHLTYSLVNGPQHGTVAFNSDGTYTYTPNADYNGSDSFTYKANDGTVDSQPATVNLTITPVNDAPIAVDAAVTTAEDTPVQNHVTATDVDGDHLTYSLVNGPQHGTVSFNSDGTYTYTPNADYNGTDSFTYKANDGSLNSNTGTVNLTVTPVNDAPVAGNATVTTAEDANVQSHVTATDVDGDHLTYSLVNGPQHGTVAFNSDGTYTYTPNADYNGTDSFTYKANDGSLNSNTGTVNLTVTPVNDAPVSANASITTAEDTNVHNHVTATDVDGDHLTYSLVAGPQHGTVTFGSDGNFVYKPLGDYFGNDSFTYQASDGSLSSNVATVALTVTPVDDAPVISADTTTLDHYETLAGASTQSQTFSAQPHVQITDVDSTQMSSATVDTHGFQHGDQLHIGSSSLFNVTVSQSGDDYHISIAAKSGSESTTHFQDFINSISFSSTSTHDGARTLDYTVTDDQHVTSNTAHGTVDIQSSYEVWASQLAPNQNTLGSGDDILHLDGKLTGKFDMGSGDDTVHFEINNGAFNHQAAPNLQNVEHIDTTGYGTNTVSLSINDVLNMTDGGHFLTIVGDKADTVNLTGDNSANHWQQTGSHDGFNVYTWSDPNHAAVVEISQIMHQSAT